MDKINISDEIVRCVAHSITLTRSHTYSGVASKKNARSYSAVYYSNEVRQSRCRMTHFRIESSVVESKLKSQDCCRVCMCCAVLARNECASSKLIHNFNYRTDAINNDDG